jgi:hypothetical protein
MIDWAASAAPLLVWLLATEATAREAALELPFIRQPPSLCVPTAAAIVLQYYGHSVSPLAIKAATHGQTHSV